MSKYMKMTLAMLLLVVFMFALVACDTPSINCGEDCDCRCNSNSTPNTNNANNSNTTETIFGKYYSPGSLGAGTYLEIKEDGVCELYYSIDDITLSGTYKICAEGTITVCEVVFCFENRYVNEGIAYIQDGVLRFDGSSYVFFKKSLFDYIEGGDSTETPDDTIETPEPQQTYEIAVITDVGTLMDGGYNQGSWEGAKAFAEANGKTVQYYQPKGGSTAQDSDRIAAMKLAISNGAKVIVAPGFLQATAMTTVALQHPEVKFIFIDGWTLTDASGDPIPNVTAVVYKEEESGFLAGYAAVMDGYTKLGYTGGGTGYNPACNRFGYGFVQGAEAAAKIKNVQVEVKFSFQHGASFSASPELKTQISGWYQGGTEVVFACGGSMFESVKAAAEEAGANAKIIGVDVDQSSLSNRVITSAVKGLKESVEIVLGQFYAGKWDAELGGKCQNLGAADNSVGLPTTQYSWRFANFTVNQYNELFASIVDGTIVIDSNAPAGALNQAWFNAKGYTNVTVIFE